MCHYQLLHTPPIKKIPRPPLEKSHLCAKRTLHFSVGLVCNTQPTLWLCCIFTPFCFHPHNSIGVRLGFFVAVTCAGATWYVILWTWFIHDKKLVFGPLYCALVIMNTWFYGVKKPSAWCGGVKASLIRESFAAFTRHTFKYAREWRRCLVDT